MSTLVLVIVFMVSPTKNGGTERLFWGGFSLTLRRIHTAYIGCRIPPIQVP